MNFKKKRKKGKALQRYNFFIFFKTKQPSILFNLPAFKKTLKIMKWPWHRLREATLGITKEYK